MPLFAAVYHDNSCSAHPYQTLDSFLRIVGSNPQKTSNGENSETSWHSRTNWKNDSHQIDKAGIGKVTATWNWKGDSGPNAKKRRFAVQLQVQMSQVVTFMDLETRQAVSSTIGKIHIRSTEQYNQMFWKIWPFQTARGARADRFWGSSPVTATKSWDILVKSRRSKVKGDSHQIDKAGGMVFHVLNRGAGRRVLFTKDEDFLAFERVVEES